jgi:hypothetical protein
MRTYVKANSHEAIYDGVARHDQDEDKASEQDCLHNPHAERS